MKYDFDKKVERNSEIYWLKRYADTRAYQGAGNAFLQRC